MDIVENNPDLGVIYFTMDDPMEATLPGFIARLAQIPINDVRYPTTVAKARKENSANSSKRAFEQIRSWMHEGKFAIFDQSHVLTLGDIETNVELVAKKMQKHNRKPVIVVDSLHSVTDPTASSGIRTDVMHHIRGLKRISNVMKIPVISVVELRKGQSQLQKQGQESPSRLWPSTGRHSPRIPR